MVSWSVTSASISMRLACVRSSDSLKFPFRLPRTESFEDVRDELNISEELSSLGLSNRPLSKLILMALGGWVFVCALGENQRNF